MITDVKDIYLFVLTLYILSLQYQINSLKNENFETVGLVNNYNIDITNGLMSIPSQVSITGPLISKGTSSTSQNYAISNSNNNYYLSPSTTSTPDTSKGLIMASTGIVTVQQNLITNGFIGIGTTNPVAKLDIITGEARSGTAPPSYGSLYVTATSGGGATYPPIAEFRHSNQSQGIAINYDSIFATGYNANQNLNLLPKGTGCVGIGTNTPAYKLHVAGDIYANGGWFRVSGANGLYWENYGRGIQAVDAGSSDYGSITTFGGGKGGWAGYNIGGKYVLMANDSNDNYLGAYSDVLNKWIWLYNKDTASCNFFDCVNKVGIGINTPSYPLHVVGDIYANGSARFTNSIILGVGSTNSPSANTLVITGEADAGQANVDSLTTAGVYGKSIQIKVPDFGGTFWQNRSGNIFAPTCYAGHLYLNAADLNNNGNNGTAPCNQNAGNIYLTAGRSFWNGNISNGTQGSIIFQTGNPTKEVMRVTSDGNVTGPNAFVLNPGVAGGGNGTFPFNSKPRGTPNSVYNMCAGISHGISDSGGSLSNTGTNNNNNNNNYSNYDVAINSWWSIAFNDSCFSKTNIVMDVRSGNILTQGVLYTNGKTNFPSGWGGGIRTWDIYASATIGAGDDSGNVKAYINGNGDGFFGNTLTTNGKLTVNNSAYFGSNISTAGVIYTNGKTNFPGGWGGGIRTWDIYASATIGAGDDSGNVKAYINGNGDGFLNNTLTTNGKLTSNGSAFFGSDFQVGGGTSVSSYFCYNGFYNINLGLKIGWNYSQGTGRTSFLNNAQGGGGGFEFFWCNYQNNNASWAPLYASSFQTVSDYRIKENIINIKDSSYNSSLYKLRPIIYFNNQTKTNDSGFIAHEVEELFPFLVNGKKDEIFIDEDNNKKEKHQTINYTGIIALCVNEIQTLNSRINNLESENKLMKEQLAFIMKRLKI